MEKEKYYITTPIYYASGDLTVGHCFCTVLADVCARFKRLEGKDVFFLTGSDEHGLKIARKAQEAGLTPQEFVDKTVVKFKDVWQKLHITYDDFIRTTDEKHIKLVEKVANQLYKQGDIYKGYYEGQYCVPCETYYTQSQLVDGKCPDCGRDVELTKEECYFFKLSKYQKYLEQLFKDKNFLVPLSRKNEIYNNFIKDGVEDLCISRSTFTWGIPLPFDKKHVVYVWIDALTNYLSALGYGSDNDEKYKKYWPANVQLVGRDITRFHTIIWPALLKALNIPAPKQVHSTGFITLKGDKISKSKSNGFNPLVLIDKYGVDALRYYLIKEGPIFEDMPYTSELFLNTINSDLCNDLGNLVSRTLAMISQNFDCLQKPNTLQDCDKDLIAICNNLLAEVSVDLDNQHINDAIKRIFAVIKAANKYIDITTPWILAKTDEGKERLKTVLYVLAESIRICAVLLQGFLVELPNKIFEQFNTPQNLQTFASAKKFSLENYGNKVVKGESIFMRLNVAKEQEFLDGAPQGDVVKLQTSKQNANDKVANNTTTKQEKIVEINIDDFDKVKIKVGEVIASERVEKSDKLLKNTVKIGDETRTIISGIAKFYNPEQMVGKKVLVVTNLKPIKLRGIESNGMILCGVTENDEELKLATIEGDLPSGSEVC